jgi:hypothetical protein
MGPLFGAIIYTYVDIVLEKLPKNWAFESMNEEALWTF